MAETNKKRSSHGTDKQGRGAHMAEMNKGGELTLQRRRKEGSSHGRDARERTFNDVWVRK